MSYYTPNVAVSLLASLLVLSACSPKPNASDAAPASVNTSSPAASATSKATEGTNQASKMTAALSGSSEVPPVTTNGSGNAEVMFNKQSNLLSWTVTYSGLSGPATAAHFHGPADRGVNAGVVVPLTGSLTSPVKGEATLTTAQAADLSAGKWYLNIHTSANPGGEIRGQVMAQR